MKDEEVPSPLGGDARFPETPKPRPSVCMSSGRGEKKGKTHSSWNRDILQTAACEENKKRQESKQGYMLQLQQHVLLCSIKGSKL